MRNSLNLFFSKALIFIFFCFSLSCKRYFLVEEIKQTDKLINRLNTVSNLLIIDDEFLRLRADSMKQRLDCISHLDTNRMNDELKYDLVTYRGFYNNYLEFLPAFNSMKYDNQKLLRESKHLRERLINKQLDKKNFDTIFSQLNQSVNSHDSFCRQWINNILYCEKMYNRINPKINRFYELYRKDCDDVH